MMTKLEELINELCPDGVEYKTINELFDEKSINCITPSFKIKRNDYKTNGLIPIVSQEAEYISGYCDLEDKRIENSEYVCFGDHSENIKYIDFQFVQGADGLKIIKSKKVNTKYLYYSLSSFYIKMNNYERHFKYLLKTKIPVPPLEVQDEIVNILDNFTELTAELMAELTAELTARQKQYAFYRDYLLDFSDEDVTKKIPDIDCSNVEYIKLGDIAKFTYGYTDKAKDNGDTRFIRITDILDNGYLNPNDAKYINLNEESKKYLLSKGDLLLARTGATYGKTLYVPNDEKAVFASFLIKIELDNTKILNRYYWHFSKSNLYLKQANKLVSTAGQPQFNTKAVSRVVIPVPPLSVQENIVKILDRFDKLNNDMSDGLPAEIEARKKQYEYYRDTLLSFDDKACSQIVKVERERES